MQREFLRNVERGDDAIGGRKRDGGFGDIYSASGGAESEQRDGDGNSAGGSIEESTSRFGDSTGNQREPFSADGDAGGQSSSDADGAGERNDEYRSELEREWNCGRKH